MEDNVILTSEENHFICMLHLVILNKYVDIHLHDSLLCHQIKIKLFMYSWVVFCCDIFIYSELPQILWHAAY